MGGPCEDAGRREEGEVGGGLGYSSRKREEERGGQVGVPCENMREDVAKGVGEGVVKVVGRRGRRGEIERKGERADLVKVVGRRVDVVLRLERTLWLGCKLFHNTFLVPFEGSRPFHCPPSHSPSLPLPHS